MYHAEDFSCRFVTGSEEMDGCRPPLHHSLWGFGAGSPDVLWCPPLPGHLVVSATEGLSLRPGGAQHPPTHEGFTTIQQPPRLRYPPDTPSHSWLSLLCGQNGLLSAVHLDTRYRVLKPESWSQQTPRNFSLNTVLQFPSCVSVASLKIHKCPPLSSFLWWKSLGSEVRGPLSSI